MSRSLPLLALLALILPASARDPRPDDLLRQAEEALKAKDHDKARELLTQAIKADPQSARPYFLRALVQDQTGQRDAALADVDRVLQLDPKMVEALDLRGVIRFKRGDAVGAVADFDRYLAVRPEARNGHWRRGIALYYAGQFAEGMKQFEGYQNVDTNDVENAAWHFLCAARKDGVEKARAGLLKIGKDARVPMMEVYALYRGDVRPEAVLQAAEAGVVPDAERKGRLFYAHLYLGLYYEVTGDAKRAREHLGLAAEKYRIGHYMGDVARVHVELLDRKKEK
jgi:lipoprotein NlpI